MDPMGMCFVFLGSVGKRLFELDETDETDETWPMIGSKVMILVNGGKISLKSLVEERSRLVMLSHSHSLQMKGAWPKEKFIPTNDEFDLF